MQGCVRTDGHITAKHVVVNRANQAGDAQARVAFRRTFKRAGFGQFGDEFGPFLPQDMCARQAAVPANHHQVVNLMLDEVENGLAASFTGAKLGAAGCADDGAALVQDAAHVVPGELLEEPSAFDKPFVPLINRPRFAAAGNRGANNGTHSGVHAGGVATAGKDTNTEGSRRVSHVYRPPSSMIGC